MSKPLERPKELNPTQLIILTFAVACIAGGLLLEIPIATHGDISFIDAVFTAASAVCVTGLVVVDTGTTFTDFGKLVILLLIQVGGLGITFSPDNFNVYRNIPRFMWRWSENLNISGNASFGKESFFGKRRGFSF